MADTKTSYQAAMDSMHAPDSLVRKTLDAMNAELGVQNEKTDADEDIHSMRQSSPQNARRFSFQHAILYFAAAAAACLALFIGLHRPPAQEAGPVFGEFRSSALLQLSDGIRGDAEAPDAGALEALLGIKADGFVPGYALTDAKGAQLRGVSQNIISYTSIALSRLKPSARS